MRLSRSPALIPATIAASTRSGFVVSCLTVMSVAIVSISFRDTVVSYEMRTVHVSRGYGKIDDTMMSRESSPKRKYELKKRAEQVAETQRRITEAAIELHGTVGPSRTTMTAIAERAGVERRTLYRHFPTEADIFRACSAHFMTANPLPELDRWRAIADPDERRALALDEVYAYWERTAPMFTNVFRDAELVEY